MEYVVWAIRGPVSEGKSTIVNALTEPGVSPPGVVETTMCPLVFVHGSPRILIHHKDGSTANEEHLDALKHYTGEAAKPAETIEVFTPSVPEGVQIVDLPGDGSLRDAGAPRMERKIEKQKADADVVIHVLTSTSRVLPSPTSKRQHHPYFVLNKTDTLLTAASDSSRIDREVDRLRDALCLNGYDDTVKVFACSPVSYLASKTLDDAACEELLALGEWCYATADESLLKALLHPITCLSQEIPGGVPLSKAERQQLVEQLSLSDGEQHGWPIFRIALLLYRPGMGVSEFRTKLREFSGIDVLRTTLLKDSQPERILPLRFERRRLEKRDADARKLSTLQHRIQRLRSCIEQGGVYDMTLAISDEIQGLEADASQLSADLRIDTPEVEAEDALPSVRLPEGDIHGCLAENWLAGDSETRAPSPLVVATIENIRERLHITWQPLNFVDADASYQRGRHPEAPDSDSDPFFTSIPLPNRPTAKDIERVAAPGLSEVKRCVVSVGAEVLLIAVDTPDTPLLSTLSTLLTDTPVRIATCALADAQKDAPPPQRPSLIVDAYLRHVEDALRTGNLKAAHLQLQRAKKFAAKQGPGTRILKQYDTVLLEAVKSAAAAATGIQKEKLLILRSTLECENLPKEALPGFFHTLAGDFPSGSHAANDMRLIADLFKRD